VRRCLPGHGRVMWSMVACVFSSHSSIARSVFLKFQIQTVIIKTPQNLKAVPALVWGKCLRLDWSRVDSIQGHVAANPQNQKRNSRAASKSNESPIHANPMGARQSPGLARPRVARMGQQIPSLFSALAFSGTRERARARLGCVVFVS
jgi:hypothetical protein